MSTYRETDRELADKFRALINERDRLITELNERGYNVQLKKNGSKPGFCTTGWTYIIEKTQTISL